MGNTSMTYNEMIHQVNQKWEQGLIAIGDYIRILQTIETCHSLKGEADDIRQKAKDLEKKAVDLRQEIIDDYNL